MIPSETKIPDLDKINLSPVCNKRPWLIWGLSLLLTIRKELPAKFCLDISERDSPHGSKAGDDEVVVPGA